jgi:hypothetical protein
VIHRGHRDDVVPGVHLVPGGGCPEGVIGYGLNRDFDHSTELS